MKRAGGAVRSMTTMVRTADGHFAKTSIGFSNAGQSAGGFFGKVRSGTADFLRMTGAFAAGQLLVDGLKSSFSGIAGAISSSIQVAAEFEQIEIALTTMLGSADAAKSMMDSLLNFAATTPFEIPGLMQSTRQLIAYGVTQEEMIPTLRMLGDLSAGVGADIGDMAYLYGTLKTQQRAYSRDLMQFANRGIPIYDALSKQFGVSASRIKEMTEAGEIGFDDVDKALRSLTGTGGKFHNLMDAQSKSLAGRWSNLQDVITISKEKIGDALSTGFNLEGVTGNMTSMLEVLTKRLTPAVEAFAQRLGSIFTGSNASAIWEFFRTTTILAATAVDALLHFSGKGVEGMGVLLGGAKVLVDDLMGLAITQARLAASMGVTGAENAAKGLEMARSAMNKTGDAAAQALIKMGRAFDQSNLAGGTRDLFLDLEAAMASGADTATEAGRNWGQSLVEGIRGTLGDMRAVATEAAGSLWGGKGGIKELWGKAQADMQKRAESLADSLRTPAEIAKAEIADALLLYRQGMIDNTTLQRFFAKTKEGLLEGSTLNIRDAQFADISNDAVGDAAREAANSRFRDSQESAAHRQRDTQIKLLEQVVTSLGGAGILKLSDLN